MKAWLNRLTVLVCLWLAWRKLPELRFGQLVLEVMSDSKYRELAYVTDVEFLRRINDLGIRWRGTKP